MDIEEQLRQFHWEDPAPELKERIVKAAHEKPAPPRKRRWPWFLAAAAAILLTIGAGAWIWTTSARNGADLKLVNKDALSAVEILGGRGRVTPVAADARFTVLDSDQGRIRLENGEVLVELETGPGSAAEVETPAGTARAQGTCFYAHYSGAEHSLLAVAVLSGQVEMATPHGQATCTAGDVAFARLGFAPHKHSGASKHPGTHHRGFCPFVSTLGLVYRPEVQVELQLTEAQKSQLQRPDTDERREMCRFFQSLHGVSPDEWAKKTNEFCADLERKVAKILSAQQQKRLWQIAYQQEGYFALLRPELVRDLQVNQDQQEGVKNNLRALAETRRTILDQNLPKPESDRQIAAAWQQSQRDAEILLTATQKEQWQRLIGPPLNLP
ncbi:MAG: FecR domain-containing protein [Planctomycetes bacterium]|nr:FecR domain-containing protein [Planctomycetota bacterium]